MPKARLQDIDEETRKIISTEVHHGRCSDIIKNYSPALLLPSTIKYEENEIEEVKDNLCFPEINETEKHEEYDNPTPEQLHHKLPNLGNKYRKFFKDSSSDEIDNKMKNPFEVVETHEYDRKLYSRKDVEVDKNDNHDMYSNNVNRSRSMLSKFNQNNTTDSRVNSKYYKFPNTVKKRRIVKDDTSSESPQRILNISGTVSKK
jgi:hypothetical protein